MFVHAQPTIDCIGDNIEDDQDDHEEEDDDDDENGNRIGNVADADIALALDFEADRRSSLNVSADADMSQEL